MLSEKREVREDKPFNPDTYQRNDPLAKAALIELFTQKGILIWRNNDKYAIDLMTKLGGVECQRWEGWGDKLFPAKEMQIFGRKEGLITGGNIFAMVNFHYDRIVRSYCTNEHREEVKIIPIPDTDPQQYQKTLMFIYPRRVLVHAFKKNGLWIDYQEYRGKLHKEDLPQMRLDIW